MNKIVLYLFLFLFLSSSFADGVYRALIIANEKYEDESEQWGELKTPSSDAKKLKNLLEQRYGFSDMVYLKNASRRETLKALRKLVDRVKEEDHVLVFYAGHGYYDERWKEGYWVPTDGEGLESDTFINNLVIKKRISLLSERCQHVLLISDSCFSGDFLSRGVSRKKEETEDLYFEKKRRLKSCHVLTSGGNEKVDDDFNKTGHSPFAYFLLERLEKNNQRYLPASEMAIGLGKVVSNAAGQTPRYGVLKNSFDNGGEFFFVQRSVDRLKEMQTVYNSLVEREAGMSLAEAMGTWREFLLNFSERNLGSQEASEIRFAAEERLRGLSKRPGSPSNSLTKMQKEFDRLSIMEGSLELRLTSWKNFLAIYSQDILLSQEDNILRTIAGQKLRELKKEQEKVTSWNKKLGAMAKVFDKLVRFYGSRASDKKKQEGWNKFLRYYGSDNPHSRADNIMRQQAKNYIAKLESKMEKKRKAEAERLAAEKELERQRAQAIRLAEAVRQKALEEAKRKTIRGFTYLRERTYSAGGQTNTVKEYRHDKTGIEFVLVPGGSFMMGSNDGYGSEKPVHRVNVPEFLMSKYEVTQGQWQKVMGSNPSYFKGTKKPVDQVSWDDTKGFCSKTGLRLPSEAEWEYACRAGTSSKYYWGSWDRRKSNNASYWAKQDLMNYGEWSNYGFGEKWKSLGAGTVEIGSFSPNSFGLYDMNGNVWEWCEDKYKGSYSGAPTNGSAWTDNGGSRRVLRGGSWDNDASNLRSANRGGLSPDDRRDSLGFRVSYSQ